MSNGTQHSTTSTTIPHISQPPTLHHHPTHPPASQNTQPSTTGTPTIDTVRIITYNTLSLGDGKQTSKPSRTSGLNNIGQLTQLCQRLKSMQIMVACLQETRLTLPKDFTTSTYHAIVSNSSKGKGGLLTLIAKSQHTHIVQELHPHQRLQQVTIQHFNTTLHITNCHAPVRDSPQHIHNHFQTMLIQHLQPLQAHPLHHSIVCVDLNARMGGLHELHQSLGPFTTPLVTECHVKTLL
eukprot:6059501-Amphidinium_carterae.5